MSIPIEIREVYQTVLDVNPKVVIDQAVDRGPFVCHSQDLSLFIKNSSPEELVRDFHPLQLLLNIFSRGRNHCSFMDGGVD